MAVEAGTVYAEIRLALDKLSQDMDKMQSLFAKAGTDVDKQTDQIAKGAKKTGNDVTKAFGDMSKSGVNQFAKMATGIQKAFMALPIIGLIAMIAGAIKKLISGIGEYLNKTTEAYQNQQTELAKLNNILEVTGATAWTSSKYLESCARALSKATGQSSNDIMAMQAQLLTYTNILGDNFDRASRAAIDMAAVMGMDVRSAAETLGRAIDSPVQGLTALTRQGFRFNAATKAQIKALTEQGNVAEAQAIILAEVESVYKGTAAAMEEAGGSAARLKNITEELNAAKGKNTSAIVEWGRQIKIAWMEARLAGIEQKNLERDFRENREEIQRNTSRLEQIQQRLKELQDMEDVNVDVVINTLTSQEKKEIEEERTRLLEEQRQIQEAQDKLLIDERITRGAIKEVTDSINSGNEKLVNLKRRNLDLDEAILRCHEMLDYDEFNYHAANQLSMAERERKENEIRIETEEQLLETLNEELITWNEKLAIIDAMRDNAIEVENGIQAQNAAYDEMSGFLDAAIAAENARELAIASANEEFRLGLITREQCEQQIAAAYATESRTLAGLKVQGENLVGVQKARTEAIIETIKKQIESKLIDENFGNNAIAQLQANLAAIENAYSDIDTKTRTSANNAIAANRRVSQARQSDVKNEAMTEAKFNEEVAKAREKARAAEMHLQERINRLGLTAQEAMNEKLAISNQLMNTLNDLAAQANTEWRGYKETFDEINDLKNNQISRMERQIELQKAITQLEGERKDILVSISNIGKREYNINKNAIVLKYEQIRQLQAEAAAIEDITNNTANVSRERIGELQRTAQGGVRITTAISNATLRSFLRDQKVIMDSTIANARGTEREMAVTEEAIITYVTSIQRYLGIYRNEILRDNPATMLEYQFIELEEQMQRIIQRAALASESAEEQQSQREALAEQQRQIEESAALEIINLNRLTMQRLIEQRQEYANKIEMIGKNSLQVLEIQKDREIKEYTDLYDDVTEGMEETTIDFYARMISLSEETVEKIRNLNSEELTMWQAMFNLEEWDEAQQEFFDKLDDTKKELFLFFEADEGLFEFITNIDAAGMSTYGLLKALQECKEEASDFYDKMIAAEKKEQALETIQEYSNAVSQLYAAMGDAVIAVMRRNADREKKLLDKQLKDRQEALDEELQDRLHKLGLIQAATTEQYELELQQAIESGDHQRILAADTALQKYKIEKEYADKKDALDKEMADKKAELDYKVAMADWVNQLAQAGINAAQAQLSIWAQVPKMDYGASTIALAAIAAGISAAQITAIAANKPVKGYAYGGIVPGSSFRGDNVITRQNSGEMNINRQQQQELWDFIRNGSRGGGGNGEQVIHITIVSQLNGREIARDVVDNINNRQFLIKKGSVV